MKSTSSGSAFQTYGTDATVYSTGAKLAPGATVFFTAGGTAAAGHPTGDTQAEALSTMAGLKDSLAKAGFSLTDVVFVRAYLAPNKAGVIDYAAWNAAWNTVFNNPGNPHKPARTTVGIPTLGGEAIRLKSNTSAPPAPRTG